MVATAENADSVATDVFAPSTMGICQPAAVCQAGNISGASSFIVPLDFVTALEATTTLDLLAEDKGFLLGLAFTPPATPLEDVTVGITGVTVEPSYLNPDLTVAAAATDTTPAGAFVIPQFTGIATMTPAKAGYTFNPAQQGAGTTAGVVFQIFFIGTPEAP